VKDLHDGESLHQLEESDRELSRAHRARGVVLAGRCLVRLQGAWFGCGVGP
jgi:hypothetical protein